MPDFVFRKATKHLLQVDDKNRVADIAAYQEVSLTLPDNTALIWYHHHKNNKEGNKACRTLRQSEWSLQGPAPSLGVSQLSPSNKI